MCVCSAREGALCAVSWELVLPAGRAGEEGREGRGGPVATAVHTPGRKVK